MEHLIFFSLKARITSKDNKKSPGKKNERKLGTSGVSKD